MRLQYPSTFTPVNMTNQSFYDVSSSDDALFFYIGTLNQTTQYANITWSATPSNVVLSTGHPAQDLTYVMSSAAQAISIVSAVISIFNVLWFQLSRTRTSTQTLFHVSVGQTLTSSSGNKVSAKLCSVSDDMSIWKWNIEGEAVRELLCWHL